MWDEAVAAGTDKHCHRVTYRILSPHSGHRFHALLDLFILSGVMDPILEVELMELNLVSTHEQRVEEIHAKIHCMNASVGRNLDPPSAAARLVLGEHMEAFETDRRENVNNPHTINGFLASLCECSCSWGPMHTDGGEARKATMV